jgi:hypothetical protein
VVTDAPGRHRRFEAEQFSPTGYLRAPEHVADPEATAHGAWGPALGAPPGPQVSHISDFPATSRPSVPDWPPEPVGASWPRWNEPSPALHPDHPSAPVPRVRAPRPPAPPGRGMPGPDMAGGGARPVGSPAYPERRPGGQGYAPAPRFQPSLAPPAGIHPGQTYPAWQGGPQRAGSVRGGQMPAMPGGRAAAITEAWSQATAIREAAENDAAAIRQEALAIREAAEREAAEMRAAILSMSQQLSRMSAYLTEKLPSGGAPTAFAPRAPAAPAVAPPAALPTRPMPRQAAPATRPRPAAPAARPARPASRPGRPAAKPKATTRPGTSQGRQARAARKMYAVLAVLVTAGAITGTAQVALHGGRFFIFRENGAGASETGLTDTQFPGHPGAPAPPKHAK